MYLIELERLGYSTQELRQNYDQAKAQIEQGGKLGFDVWFDLQKSIHSIYARAIKVPSLRQEEEEKQLAQS